jgi:aminopeptidase N
MSRDDDGFVRWDSAQALAVRVIQEVQAALRGGQTIPVDPLFVQACEILLADDSLDPAMVAEMLRLPGENYLAELAGQTGGADVDGIHRARELVQVAIGNACREGLLWRYDRLAISEPYAPEGRQIAARSLRNTCLEFLAAADRHYLDLASRQFEKADNMTDRLAALRVIAIRGDDGAREAALGSFHEQWRHETLVVNLWLQVQASIPDEGALARVSGLLSHPDFDLRNPNRVRALIGTFTSLNPVNFHRLDGAGYRFLADRVGELNTLNPQIAARLLTPLTRWRQYTGRAELMRAELERLATMEGLSPDVYEVVSKSLQAQA